MYAMDPVPENHLERRSSARAAPMAGFHWPVDRGKLIIAA